MDLRIEYISKEDLKPYANNVKIHTDEQIGQIKKSIEEFGFNDPIAVWHDNEIIEGHGRLLAAMEMENIDKIPIIRLDDLTDEQRRAYMLVHNKLTMNTGFNGTLLSFELSEIIEKIDMTNFGFSEFEISLATEDFLPEEYDNELLSEYDEHSNKFLARKRIIITYKEGEEEAICKLLNIEKEKMRVVYSISELLEN